MHSSRMRTGRSLTVCCSLLPGGEGFCLSRGGSACPGGDVLPGPGGSSPWSGGVLPAGGVFSLVCGGPPCRGGVLPGPRGVCLVRGGSPETPPVNRITDTCKNITLAPTSLRPVIRLHIHTVVGFPLHRPDVKIWS